MTHDELVQRAKKWLRNSCRLLSVGDRTSVRRCSTVATEITTYAYEVPDAIGWASGTSVLIECKTSRSDYYADKKKPHRQDERYGMGNYRFYMTEPGLLVPDNLPDKWGLLEVCSNSVNIVKHAEWREAQLQDEKHVLLSIIRRMKKGEKGF